MRSILAVLAFAAFCSPADAQLPPLPGGDIIGRAAESPLLGGVLGAADEAATTTAATLRAGRSRAMRALRLANPAILDRDPRGETIVRSEVIAIAPSEAALAAARQAGFEIARREDLGALDVSLVVLRAPPRIRSTRAALAQLRALDPAGAYDFNHLYAGSGAIGGARTPMQAQANTPVSDIRIGVIDGGVDSRAPALAGLRVTQRAFAGTVAPSAHGDAVASLLAANTPSFRGAAPGADLFVADVYGGAPTGGSASAIAAAFGWLAQMRTPVINASIVGPPNAALEAIVRAMTARGYVIVAAVGNDGPAAPPLYPAAYPGVIGVTAVDGRDRALVEAARGCQVDIAAPGSDMLAAGASGLVSVRGTSFAAPIAAGLIAREIRAPSPAAQSRAIELLRAQAQDLGARGVDETYGAGLVGRALRVPPSAIAAR